MLNAIASSTGFVVLLAFFAVGMIGALIGNKSDRFANIWSGVCASLGALYGLLFASSVLITGHEIMAKITTSNFSFFSIALHIDKLAAFFIGVISLIALFCSVYGIAYVREYYKRYNIGVLGFLYNLFIVGMLLVVTAANGIWFLLAWEIMSLASYFLVVYDRQSAQNVKAGYVYLVMTHVGAACILLALAVLFNYTHSFDFDVIKANAHLVPVAAMGAAFVLVFIGLGTKAGVIPLHIWLPSAHPAAPSHVSALMSGVMIKTGIYMMIRLFLDVLQPIPTWWGVVVLAAGAISTLLGVLYALTEHDIKRLLAYHSIENIGIILLGLGSAMIFAATHRPGLELLALAAALFHTLNHATFKSLLFLSAGAVIQATHTRNIEKYGGLLRVMPFTGLLFLVGSMAISALPPFNGFFSEWLTYQSLFSGIAGSGHSTWIFLVAAASLAVTGGLALACFVKVFGTTFLARPRSVEATRAKESSWLMITGMSCLGVVCLVLGVCSGSVMHLLQNVGGQVTGVTHATTVVSTSYSINAHTLGSQDSSVSGVILAGILVAVVGAIWFATTYGIYRKQKIRIAATWDCGTPLTGRNEITATGFARSIVLIFGRLLKPSLQHHTTPDTAINPYVLKARSVSLSTRDIYQAHAYRPAYAGILTLSRYVKHVQNGNLNTYVLYIFGALLLALLIGAF